MRTTNTQVSVSPTTGLVLRRAVHYHGAPLELLLHPFDVLGKGITVELVVLPEELPVVQAQHPVHYSSVVRSGDMSGGSYSVGRVHPPRAGVDYEYRLVLHQHGHTFLLVSLDPAPYIPLEFLYVCERGPTDVPLDGDLKRASPPFQKYAAVSGAVPHSVFLSI